MFIGTPTSITTFNAFVLLTYLLFTNGLFANRPLIVIHKHTCQYYCVFKIMWSFQIVGYKNKGIVLNSILSVEFNNTTSLVFHFIINYQWYIHFVWKIDFIFYDKKILFMKLIQLKYPVLKSSRSCFYSFPKLYFNSTSKMIYSMIKKIEFMKLI